MLGNGNLIETKQFHEIYRLIRLILSYRGSMPVFGNLYIWYQSESRWDISVWPSNCNSNTVGYRYNAIQYNIIYQFPSIYQTTVFFCAIFMIREVTMGHIYWYGLTLTPAWICNHMPINMWNKITYPFPHFNDLSYLGKEFNYLCHVNVGEWHKMEIYVSVSCENCSTWSVNRTLLGRVKKLYGWLCGVVCVVFIVDSINSFDSSQFKLLVYHNIVT